MNQWSIGEMKAEISEVNQLANCKNNVAFWHVVIVNRVQTLTETAVKKQVIRNQYLQPFGCRAQSL